MVAARRPESGFWLADRLTPREADWIAYLTSAVLSGAALSRLAANVGPPAIELGAFALVWGLATVPLLWRRQRPGTSLAMLGAAAIAGVALGSAAAAGSGVVLGAYAASAYGDRRVRLATAVTAAAVLLLAFAAASLGEWTAGGHLVLLAFGYGVAWIVGDRTRNRRAYLVELQAHARRLEEERDLHALRAAQEERVRIARELHDVVAHNVSVIAVQAGGGRMAAQTRPERAVEALSLIEATARTTLSELRSLLGVLRSGAGEAAPRGPQPSLDQARALVQRARAAGIAVTWKVEGEPRPLPALLELCGYRVIQEALTNSIRHAPGSTTEVEARYEPDQVVVTVCDDGPGPAQGGRLGGGIIGMRERVALAGGELTVGAGRRGGFLVQARLPAPPAAGPAPRVVG